MNYDAPLWNRIRLELVNNHENIDVTNRAQIVDDAFNLARAGEISYTQAFNLINYLYNETNYFPWYSALKGFDYLISVYGESSDVGRMIIDFQLYLLQNAFKSVTFTDLNEEDQIHSLRLSMILNRLCQLGEENCIEEARSQYEGFINGTR